jgi:hypothetical protein
MRNLELVLELPVANSNEADLPDARELPRSGAVAYVSGFNGDHVLQATVIVTAGTVRLLRTWLLTRVERLKETRVVWNGREFRGYSAQEVELLVQSLERELADSQSEQ